MKKLFMFLFLCGCSASIGSYEKGLWYDSDKRDYNPKGVGIKADIVCGQMVRPISFDGDNPWKDPDFVLKCPICGPYFSVALGELGFYIGLKSFRNHEGRYEWLPSDANSSTPDILFTPSATTRRTRWK